MDAYALTDMAGEHYLLVGPGGLSFVPVDGDDLNEKFVTAGLINAKCFAAFLKNEHDCHVTPVQCGVFA